MKTTLTEKSIPETSNREQMNVVIVGHVDHGKSTVIGRLLVDTGALPQGKLEEIKARCIRNARPFEYAFLLDALKDEQAQGITIDTARSFFKSKKRDYIIIDAPGHIEFLKNMITGAARAEAALLIIDAAEGIKENSKRHGYMLSFLGIKNITVCVNKMDLVNYSEKVFNQIKDEYTKFLKEIHIEAQHFIPISAMEGENMIARSSKMPWFKGISVLEALDSFTKKASMTEQPFRMPVQDIYKFTAEGDDRRIVAGRVESGTLSVGEEVIFMPSNKKSKVKSIESFNTDTKKEIFAGQSAGVTLDTQIYIRPGEIMCKATDKLPSAGTKFKANIFWMGKQPLVQNKKYKLKITTQQVPVLLTEILNVLNASELSSVKKSHVDRHEVAECILETMKPVAFDAVADISATGRFVIVDNYEISGGGIILAPIYDDQSSSLNKHILKREYEWERSHITPDARAFKYQHKSALIVLTGQVDTGKQRIAKALEEELFKLSKFTYFLGISNRLSVAHEDNKDKVLSKFEHIQQLGELAHLLTDSGLILITSITDIDAYELEMLKTLNQPNKTLVINVGENRFSAGQVDLNLIENEESQSAVSKIVDLLIRSVVLDPEYNI